MILDNHTAGVIPSTIGAIAVGAGNLIVQSAAVSNVSVTSGALNAQGGGTVTFQSSAATSFGVGILAAGWTGGTGTIKILGDATAVNVGQWVSVARDVPTSTGTMIVGAANGSDAPTLNIGQFLDVGSTGNGNLTLNGGAKVTVGQGMSLATGSGAVGLDSTGNDNLDGVVNLADLNKLLNNYGASSATWSMGDFNYDGIVNLADLNLLLNNYGRTFTGDSVSGAHLDAAAISALGTDGITVVPEPGTLCSAGRRPRRLAGLRLA